MLFFFFAKYYDFDQNLFVTQNHSNYFLLNLIFPIDDKVKGETSFNERSVRRFFNEARTTVDKRPEF